MSAEILRRAAALMRERAEAALVENDWKRAIAKLGRLTPKGQHMQGWHPAVALAVADWLESEANEDGFSHEGEPYRIRTQQALKVASAYLEEQR